MRHSCWAVVLTCGLLVGGCAAPMAGDQQAQPTPAATSGQWLSDAKTGCRFWTTFRGAATANWSGECRAGNANGDGVAILRGPPEPSDGEIGSPSVRIYGQFRAGLLDGRAIVFYPTGTTEIATYANGIRVGQVALHKLVQGQDYWGVIDAERMPLLRTEIRRSSDVRELVRTEWQRDPKSPFRDYQKVTELFDFHRYKDLESARTAIDAAFPAGKPASALIDAFNTAAERQNGRDISQIYIHSAALSHCRHAVSLATLPNLGWICVTSLRLDAGQENADIWTYIAYLTEDATLLSSDLRLLFDDHDFRARGVPLKAENFASNEALIRAAWQILGPHPAMTEVVALMSSAGLKDSSESAKSTSDDIKTLEFIGSGIHTLFSVTGCSMQLDLVWRFDASTGAFDSVAPGNRGVTCL